MPIPIPPAPITPRNGCHNCAYHLEGECHRFPPSPVGNVHTYSRHLGGGDYSEGTETDIESHWPGVTPTSWCGEWKESGAARAEAIRRGFAVDTGPR